MTVKVPQVQLMDMVVKVPEIMKRQVPTSKGAQKDQMLGDEQIGLEVYVDRMKDGQNDMCVQQEGSARDSSAVPSF